jgi:undecaprenyl-diphosphatase
MGDLTSFDQGLLQTAHSVPPSLVPLFVAITNAGGAYGVVALVPFLIWRKTRVATAWLVGALCAQGVVVAALKVAFGRVRPCAALEWCNDLKGACPTSGSFPSGHAAGSMCFAAYIAVRYPKWGLAAVVWAVQVACSRCVLGEHYPTDVMAGALLGACFGIGFGLFAKKREFAAAA